jgi:hypothetical protein
VVLVAIVAPFLVIYCVAILTRHAVFAMFTMTSATCTPILTIDNDVVLGVAYVVALMATEHAIGAVSVVV